MKTVWVAVISLTQLASSLGFNYFNKDETDTYDFIIIGAGASGSVLANRLSEIQGWKILLLEAGGNPNFINEVPALSLLLQFTKFNWGYKAEKQDGFCHGCAGGRLQFPLGKVLGGSTSINHIIHTRCHPVDYDRWAAMGNPGWSYKDVLPYFLKSEDAHIEIQDEKYHHQGGYLTVTDAPIRTKSAFEMVAAAEEAGLPYVDYNGRNETGVSFVQGTLRKGRRCSAEKAFLRPARVRKNLSILTKAMVVQILINPDTKEAYGVKYQRKGRNHTVLASKEVLLCAGTFNSPQLLMLSGVGPKKHLEELGISVVQDLPVGQKMYDHPAFSGVSYHINDTNILYNLVKGIINPNTYIQFLLKGRGLLSTINGIEAISFIKSNVSTDPEPSYPDIELLFPGFGYTSDFGLVIRRVFNIPTKIYNTVWRPYVFKGVIQMAPILLHPKSQGYIKLQTKSPFDAPKLFANYFSDPENHDVRTLIASVREIQKIFQMPSMQKYKAKLIPTPIPGCEQHQFDSDNYWECAIRTIPASFYHQTSTCKMGPWNDTESVVDADLKVHGIKKLRVVDASVIPLPLSGHTAAPVYMIGEKASDLIKGYWGETAPTLKGN